MGCCFSSAERGDPHAQNPSRPDLSPPRPPARPCCSNTGVTRTAAPLAEEEEEEEETVKEVLSETPLPKPHPPPQTTIDDSAKADAGFSPKPEERALEARTPTRNEGEDVAEVVSECSELCSVGESFSTASATTATTATTVAEKRETEVTSRDRGEVTQRVIKRSPMKVQRNRPYSGEQTARRAARSPAKKTELAKKTTASPATQQRSRMGTTTAALRRDQRDGLGRRSRSPATRNGGGGRKSGAGGSPMKKAGNAGGASSATSAGDVEEKVSDTAGEGGDTGDSKQGNESVDNPLVSLECFIFL
ncbi:hypothetical protein ACJRO7_001776 [Eucalyptus globulus]|uniref:Uncharacterized protein n=1 Tax=Eucalyptus globulus TaxID=34317 RepID=A0ABD3LVD4_EUCGL